jgi:hypothetical protein
VKGDEPEFRDQKEVISLTIVKIIINNQIKDTQFPVLLAPNKRKVGDDQPFLAIQVLLRKTYK